MLLTIETTHQPATDLGYLLHKHPERFQTFTLNFGQAHVFYPEAGRKRASAALLLDIDPVGLVRGKPGDGPALEQYVNDRPYIASSYLSVAIAQVYGSALSGRSTERQEVAESAIPLTATLSVIAARGGESIPRRLFEPLGYQVEALRHPLDRHFPEWGDSPYYTLTLSGSQRLRDLLAHLYVLLPVLDDDKHYWVGDDEVEKLLRQGGDWLAAHPERNLIVSRYLKHRKGLVRVALERLSDGDIEAEEPEGDAGEAEIEARVSLNQQRIGAVVAALKAAGARRVLDLGCGEGQLLRALLPDPAFDEIVGMDVSARALEHAEERLGRARASEARRRRVRLLHGSLTYRDERLAGFDAAAVVEVVEHLDPGRLSAFERVLFRHARPRAVVLTTPNVEYNVRFESLPAGRFRHRDHRFEWTRAEFAAWTGAIAARHGYTVRHVPIGNDDLEVGPPTQMAVFSLPAGEEAS